MPPYKVVVFAMRKSNSSSDSLPVGSIIWYSVSSIPTGWKKYDAQQRFLLGRKKGVYALGTSGGATEIVLDSTHLPLHQHSYNYPYYENFHNSCAKSTDISCPDFNVINVVGQWGITFEAKTSHIGSDTPSSIPILPPYRSLYCIQKTDLSADIPVGAICAWANKDGKTQIPTGWVICDTTNNSPDLRGYFVYTDNTKIGGSGGTNSIELTSNHLPSHSHVSNYYKYPPGYNLCESSGNLNVSDTSSPTEQVNYTSGIVGKSATQKTLQTIPPFIVLLYIMKVF
jgi:microcystin-dependent protein